VTREEFAAQCERAALSLPALPVSSAILKWTAEQLKRSEPAWWKTLAKAWDKRAFGGWTDPWRLYLACLHFEALNDAECPLVPYFPSCGGTAEADPASAVHRLLSAPPPSFVENLRTRQMRPFRGNLSSLWIAPAMLFFQRRNMPYYIVEVEAGAGLNLAADLFIPQKGFRQDLVDARVGLDRAPIVVEDILQRRWLTACQFTDDAKSISFLDLAVDKLIAANKEDASFIQLAPCHGGKAPAFVAKNIPPEDDTGLLFFNFGVTGGLSDADYAFYSKAVGGLLSRWGDRGLWVELELVRGERFSTTLQLRVYRWMERQLRGMVMTTMDLAAGTHQYVDAVDQFLATAPAKK
jgi:hypothetical protein